MSAAMSVVMLASAATGLCCSAWGMAGTRAFAVLLNALMGVMSVDVLQAALTGTTTRLPLVLWAALLVAAAMTAAVARGRSPGSALGHHRAMSAHRSIGAIVMAVALLVPLAGTSSTTTASMHSHGDGPGVLTVVLIAGTALVLLLAMVAVAPLRGWARTVALVESLAMTGACAAMTMWHWQI